MEDIEHLAIAADPLLACCLCKRMLREAVQLACLHNCCRFCFSSAASSCGSSQDVACGVCGSVNQSGTEQPNALLDRQVQRFLMIADSKVCGVCKRNGELDKPALVWCPDCQHSLCGDCVAGHRQYYRQHMTKSLEELTSLEEVCRQPSVSACTIHNKPMDIACLICERVTCTSCSADCMEKTHKMCIVEDDSFESFVGQFISSIRCMVTECIQKSEILQKPKVLLLEMSSARDRHLEEAKQRKRRVIDAVEKAYQDIEFSIQSTYGELKEMGEAIALAAESISSNLSDVQNYVRRLIESNNKCEIVSQQKMVRERLRVMSTELDALNDSLATTGRSVNIDASLPDDLEECIRAWIGTPAQTSASVLSGPLSQTKQNQHQQCLPFDSASGSLQLPVDCCKFALTHDGLQLLAAAGCHGLIELSLSSRCELSRWTPLKQSNGQHDWVVAVAALSGSRAAVSLLYARLIVLLSRSERKGVGSGRSGAKRCDPAWTENCRLDQLSWPSRCLSAHGDILAATEGVFGRRLQLLSLSTGHRLSVELQREYGIFSLAVVSTVATGSVVVTVSCEKLMLSGSLRSAQVLDAYSIADGEERLWRRQLSSSEEEEVDEEYRGICADATGRCLYAAVQRCDRSAGHVTVLSLADGNELQRISLFTYSSAPRHPRLLLPVELSISNGGAAAEQPHQGSSHSHPLLLAVLSWDSTIGQCRTVTLYRSTDVGGDQATTSVQSFQRKGPSVSPPPILRMQYQEQQPQQQQQQQQSISIDAPTVSIQLPQSCSDVALTKDGRLLLVASLQDCSTALIEWSCSSGCELSRWQPCKQSSYHNDSVQAVAALSDGRAAVSLLYAQLVVLLRRSERTDGSSSAGALVATWTVERYLDQLPWPPRWLSAHDDVIGVTEGRSTFGMYGTRLQLLSLSSGQQLCTERQRKYRIFSLAIAAGVVVTVSSSKVELARGRRAAQVLDANRLTDDKLLWRLSLSYSREEEKEEEMEEEHDEELWGICADPSGGCLYAIVRRSDRTSSRVAALSLSDGSQLRIVELSFRSASAQQLQQPLPERLSLCGAEVSVEQSQEQSGCGRVLQLATLCCDSETRPDVGRRCRTVNVHCIVSV